MTFQLLLENSFLINIINTGEIMQSLSALAALLKEGPGFDPQYPFANSEPSVTWVVGHHTTGSDLREHQAHMRYIDLPADKISIHIKYNQN